MTQLAAKRIRLAVDPYDHTNALDVLTNVLPKLWRGTSVSIEVGIFQNGVIVSDVSNISELVLEIHGSIRLSVALTYKSKATAELSTITGADWLTKAADKYNARFDLIAGETQYEGTITSSAQSSTFWIVLHAVLVGGSRVTLGGTQLTVEEDGVDNGIPPIGVADAPLWNITGNNLQLWNDTLQTYQTVYITGAAGAESIAIGATS